ncbi:MAG TPA: hypothetical protein VN721_12850 [Flavipsychrobacter sp.]|nr:hypothetical protein [Flavipsychrobacter sp.]
MQISELILKTASIHRTKLFYNKTLELPIIIDSEDSISFKAGKTILTFEAITEGKPYYHIAFNITNNKFSDSYEWINNKLDILPVEDGINIASYPNWNAQSFYFYDNNASILEFIVRFDLPYYSPKPFSVDDIIEISEIGIVVNNTEQTSKELYQQFKISYFEKGPRLPEFIVMGDDYGLLLISQQGRQWVPTHKPALPFPLTIKGDDITLKL